MIYVWAEVAAWLSRLEWLVASPTMSRKWQPWEYVCCVPILHAKQLFVSLALVAARHDWQQPQQLFQWNSIHANENNLVAWQTHDTWSKVPSIVHAENHPKMFDVHHLHTFWHSIPCAKVARRLAINHAKQPVVAMYDWRQFVPFVLTEIENWLAIDWLEMSREILDHSTLERACWLCADRLRADR